MLYFTCEKNVAVTGAVKYMIMSTSHHIQCLRLTEEKVGVDINDGVRS